MTTENLVHIKLEYEEGLQAKGDIIYLETDLFKILKSIRTYHQIRMKEMELKIDLAKKIRIAGNSLKSLKSMIPKPIIPQMIKKEKKQDEVFEVKEKAEENDLEEQLREISEKLKSFKA